MAQFLFASPPPSSNQHYHCPHKLIDEYSIMAYIYLLIWFNKKTSTEAFHLALFSLHNYYYSTLVLVQYQCCDRLHFRYQNGQFLSYPVLDVVIQCSLLLLFQLSICLVLNTSIFLPYYICLSMFRYVRL